MSSEPSVKRVRCFLPPEQSLVSAPKPKAFPMQSDIVALILSNLNKKERAQAQRVSFLFNRVAQSHKLCQSSFLTESTSITTPELLLRRDSIDATNAIEHKTRKQTIQFFPNFSGQFRHQFVSPRVVARNCVLTFYEEVKNSGIEKGLAYLETLSIDQKNAIDRVNLAELQKNNFYIEDNNIEKLFRICPKIKKLKFFVTPSVSGSFLKSLPEDFEGFEELDFDYFVENWYGIGENDLDSLEKPFCNHLRNYFKKYGTSSIKTLSLVSINSDVFFETFDRKWDYLEKFESPIQIKDNELEVFALQAPNLKQLKVDGNILVGLCLVHMHALESLDIYNCRKLDLKLLEQCLRQNAHSLKNFTLDCSLGGELFKDWPNFPHLESAQVPDFKRLTVINRSEIGNPPLAYVRGVQTLEIRDAQNLEIATLRHCLEQNAETLESLSIDCRQESDFFEALPVLPNLREIKMPTPENQKAFIESLSLEALTTVLRSFPQMPKASQRIIRAEIFVKQCLS